jgi:hypothetical protein
MRVRLNHCVALLGLSGLWAGSLAVPAAHAADARFEGAAANGSVALFSTTDKLVPGDTDSFRDVYERSFDSGVGTYVTREVSTGPTGGNDAYAVNYQGASTGGRKVFFSTQEPLAAADADRSVDVYRRDPAGGTVLASASAASCSTGTCGNGPADATFKGATPDGGKVFFETSESLIPADGDGAPDVYMRDMTVEPPTTILVSRADPSCAVGPCGNGPEGATFVGTSDSGEKVFFETGESLSVADGDGGASDVYLRDLGAEPHTTTPVSAGGTCPGVEASACTPKFRGASADGSRAFFTTSQQFSLADTDKASDVYVWEGGAPSLLSTGPTDGNDDLQPAIFAGSTPSGDTAFIETSEPLTAADEDAAADVYARRLPAGTTTLVSAADPTCTVGECGKGPENAAFSASSTGGGTVFFSTKESLAPADDDSVNDVYSRDLAGETTVLVSRASAPCEAGACGAAAPVKFAAAAAGGGAALFSTAEPLVEADADESEDIYMRDLGASSTSLQSPSGICPLFEEKGCDATFAGASEDVSHVFFRSAERLLAEDVDSDLDVYERAEGKTRLVSAGNSVDLGPATPLLTATSPASPSPSLTPSIRGHADANTSIKLYTSSDCSGAAIAGTVTQLEGAGISVTVASGSTTSFRATATDGNGDTSGCSNAISYKQEAPSPPPGEGEGGGGGGGSPGGGSGGGPVQSPAPSSPSPAAATPTLVPTHDGIAYVAPVTRITFGPAFKTRVRNPVFRFTDSTGQPGTSFVCRLDRRHWKPCESPSRLEHVSRGKHVFMVKARNAVGTWEAHPSKRAFKLVGGRR